MHDRPENSDERPAVGEVQVQLDGWILERSAAPRASPEVYRVEVANGRLLGVPRLQDLRARLARPSRPGQEHPIARRCAPKPCRGEHGSSEHRDRCKGPQDREQGEASATHPRSLIRKSTVPTTLPVSRFSFPAFVTRILTATGAL